MIKKYILSIGLNDKQSLKQEIKTQKAISIIKNTIAGAGFGGCSIYGGIGFYTMDNGAEVIEKTLKVEVLNFNNNNNIHQVIQDIGTALNQESIALQVENVDSDLVYIK